MQIQPFNHKKFLLVFLAVVWPQVHLTVHIKKVQVAAVLTLIEWMMDGIIRRRPIIWHIDATQGSCFDRLARDWWRQRREKKWSELTSTDARFFIICSNTHTQLNWLPFIAQDLKSHFQWPHILHLLTISKHLISNWSEMTPEYKCNPGQRKTWLEDKHYSGISKARQKFTKCPLLWPSNMRQNGTVITC